MCPQSVLVRLTLVVRLHVPEAPQVRARAGKQEALPIERLLLLLLRVYELLMWLQLEPRAI